MSVKMKKTDNDNEQIEISDEMSKYIYNSDYDNHL